MTPTPPNFLLGQYSYYDHVCRQDDRELEAAVRVAIKANDIPSLVRRQFQPVAVRLLLDDLKPYARAFVDALEGGPLLPVRVMRGLSLGRPHKTYTRAQTVNLLRNATGTKATIIAGILTGKGHPSAVLIRRLAETIKGVPLDVYDIDQGAAHDTDKFVRRSEATKRAARTRKAREAAEPSEL
jgi:hypothetical protein